MKWLEYRFSTHPWLVPLTLFIGCCLFFSNVYPFNYKNGILHGKDLLGYTYPYFDFISQEVRAGNDLPLWNPHQLAGFSIIGSGEVNIFYPFNWLTFVWDVRKAITILTQLHVFIGMWGVTFTARQLGSSYSGSVVGGLIWGSSGFIAARLNAGHYTLLLPMAWLPWVLGSYIRALKMGTWQAGWAGAVSMGLLHLAGHPQVAFVAGFMLLGVWGFTVLSHPFGARFGAATRPLLMIVILGTTLGAIDILPVVDTALISDRNVQQDRFEFANRFSLPANQLITFVFPKALGSENTVRGDPNFEELFAYVGLMPLIAVVALLQRPTPEIWLLVVLGSLGILLSLAMNGGVLRLLIQVVPQLGIFRSAGRWLALTQIALACLSALWITRLQEATPEDRYHSLYPLTHRSLPILVVLFFMLAFLLSLARSVSSDFLTQPDQLWNVAQIVAKAGLMLLLLLLALLGIQNARQDFYQALGALIIIAMIDLWSVTLPLIPVGSPHIYGQFWRNLQTVLPADETGLARLMIDPERQKTLTTPTALGYYDINGYEQLVSEDYNLWIKKTDPWLMQNRLLGVQYVVSGKPFEETVLQRGFKPLLESEAQSLYIYETETAVPRAFLAEVVLVEPDGDKVREFFANELFGVPEVVWVDQELPCQQNHYAGGEVEIVSYQPNHIQLAVKSDGVGLLLLSDQYAAGWQAQVNGQSTPIFRADTIFRAVCVPAGTSEVVFSYHPRSLYIGAILTLGSLGILAGWFLRYGISSHDYH